MMKYGLDKNAFIILKVVLLFILFVIYVLLIYLLYYFHDNLSSVQFEENNVATWLTVIFAAVAVFTVFFYLPVYQKTAVINLSKSEISFEKGVIYRRKDYLVLENVVYFSQIKVPVLSKYGCNFALISSVGARLFLPFLSQEDLEKIAEKFSLNEEET